ncbi:MAG TPA: bifunctional homocysteine S-methyltransferase/methylenetetrahydrofolate reductase [Anaerolineaceae bacterium]|nr:bifunctional homocysteine S-methyltransferase/methylenetetrahydrofolate reductase [Anaerolineaceae bacterium]
MKSSSFTELLHTPHPILSDGAMGTLLHQRGVNFEQCFDLLNLDNPAMVAAIHREYIEAGSQMIQTNTFGANRFKLAQHGLENRTAEINAAAVELARRVILASFKEILIVGDVGPLGVRLAPFGRVQPEQARQAFSEQIGALAEAGVDLLIIETMTDLYEVKEAVAAARQVAPQLPIIASMTFTRDDRTLLGDSPAKVARFLQQIGAEVIGVNCSGGPSQILSILRQMRQAVPEVGYSVMPNAGWPQQASGRIMYPAAPEYFGEYALTFWQEGARVIGGCCGTTPAHLEAMRRAIDSAPQTTAQPAFKIAVLDREEEPAVQPPTQLAEKIAAGRFVIAAEMDPPRGLSTHKLLAGASLLSDAGADVIDVADSPMARMRMSPWAVCSLIQKQIGVETVLHFPTRGRNLLRVQGDLLAAHALGVRNVFVVMGDPTAIGDYPDAMDNYDLVPSGLIKLIKQGFNEGIDHAGMDIGQPTSFFVGCALNLTAGNLDDEVKNLRRKLKAGADFILTQPVFDVARAAQALQTIRAAVDGQPVPILIGILPLASARHAAFLHHEVPGILVPEGVRTRMESAGENAPRAGIEIAIELVAQMRSAAPIEGIYIMPAFSRFDHAAEVIEAVRASEPGT